MQSSCSMSCSDEDESSVKHRMQFSDSLKDLKNLRKQLYSAADYFEESYNRDNHKQFVVESSKDYVAKALVNTVDHLGSVADKLNKFLNQKANQFSSINTKFSGMQERLCMIQGLVQWRGMSHHLLEMENHRCNNKHSIIQGKSNVLYGSLISSLPAQDDVHPHQKENSFSKSQRMKVDPPLRRRKEASRDSSPNPHSFSFTKKEAISVCKSSNNIQHTKGRRSISPHRLAFNLISNKRSVSPSPSLNKGLQECYQLGASEPQRAISACRTREMRSGSREIEVESYTRKSKHLLKALLSRKHIQHKQMQG